MSELQPSHVFRERVTAHRCPAEERLSQWVDVVVAAVGLDAPVSLTIRFVDSEEGRMLNREYRGKDYATNVLSFPLEQPDLPVDMRADEVAPDHEPRYIGDLVICAPVVEREAVEQDKPRDAHFAHMVVHGVLHLLGYDHEDAAEAEEMEALEVTILASLGLPNPYQTD